MRLHRLEICGFGPFRERQVVDFDAFTQDGIFLIAGRTGAGKSSILDAVCFGLYGSVPRYDGGEKRLRSDHCEPDDPSEVVVEFSTTAGRFRVTRSPEYLRPAKRGGGMTKQAAGVALDQWIDGTWAGRAARAVDVANELDEILQLSQSQFLQVILLAQNRFARFLLADSRERQTLLRRLFGTERFEDVQSRFDDRRRSSENALSARIAAVGARLEQAEALVTAAALRADAAGTGSGAQGAADVEGGRKGTDAVDPGDAEPSPGEGSTDERLEGLRRALARAGYQAERAAAERDDAERAVALADRAVAVLRDDRAAQQERDRARAELARLDEVHAQIDAARAERDAGRSAEALRPLIAVAARAETARRGAREVERSARAAWERIEAADADAVETAYSVGAVDAARVNGTTEAAEGPVEALEARVAQSLALIGALRRAVELEAESDTRAAGVLVAQEEVAAATAAIASDEAERVALPMQRTEAASARDAARRSADRAADLAGEKDRAHERMTATVELERLAASAAASDRSYANANQALTTAQSALTRLLQRRLDGMAGELAAELHDGEICPVCGATEHPALAEHTDPVSADDVDAAQRDRDLAAVNEREAGELLAGLRAEAAAATARADGRTTDAARSELDAATAAHDLAVADVGRLPELDAELAAFDVLAERLETRRAHAADVLAAAREALAVAEERSREAEQLISAARGPFESVAERVAVVTEHAAAARAFADAIAEFDRSTEAAVQALREQDAAVADSEFHDAVAAEAALRSPADLADLDARISAHAVQRETEKAILLPLEMRALPEEPIDLAAAEQTAADARAAWTTAVDAAGRAGGIVERLGGLIASAADEHQRGAEQLAEHEALRSLADTIAGRAGNTHRMNLETFVLAAELEEIVGAANRRLADMSTGRYQLRHSDALAARGAASGLGIVVFDAFTGQTRPAQSLSGGETFLSSLALALGLAEVVTARAGGVTLDTLFIDEGFGSLDADTLDVAMRTLDELRSGGRTVGVISHVEAMQEQIPAQLRVEQTESGSSRIVPPAR